MDFSLSPSIVLLGDYTDLQFKSTYLGHVFGLARSAAKKCILVKWIEEDPPSHSQWVSELNICMPLEKITYNIKGKHQRFFQTWKAWTDFFRNITGQFCTATLIFIYALYLFFHFELFLLTFDFLTFFN